MSADANGARRAGRIWTALGPRAVEAALFAALEPELGAARADPALLARPLRVVVPSRSLRDHVGAALVRWRGGGVAGVSVQTLFGVALEVTDRCGARPAPGQALLPVRIRGFAREEPALAARLDTLVDGYGVVEAAVNDLLDAGLEAAHRDALEDCLAAGTVAGEDVAVAGAVVRVALRVQAAIATGEAGHRSQLLREARALLEADPERALPARAVFVHGFADATGVAADWIEALVRTCGAHVLLDATREGVAFTRRFRERLAGTAPVEAAPDADPSAPAAPTARGFAAPGAEAEAREVARRVGELLEAGAEPERIGVVVRDLSPYGLALRRHLGRLGIPFSGVDATGPGGALARRVGALGALLREGSACPADRWQDALVLREPGGRPSSRTRRADLRLGLRHLGAARVGLVARLAVDGDVPLPVRRGLYAASEETDESGALADERRDEDDVRRGAPRRTLESDTLALARRAARAACDRLHAWPSPASVTTHLAELHALLEHDLGWRRGAEQTRPVFQALAALALELPGDASLERDDWGLVVQRRLGALREGPIGGRGGGVQVLSVMEARARTFEHLFVLGLNRDVFPRPVREDALLPDAVRQSLLAVLPDLAVKARGWDEERFLFGQLLAASPSVVLSWQAVGDDGRARPLSTLVERLRWDERLEPEPPAPAPLDAAVLAPGSPHTAAEHALLAGLHGSRREVGPRLRIAAQARAAALADRLVTRVAPEAFARARRAVIDELDAAPFGPVELGPYYGLVGDARETADPRRGPLWVTRLEGLARCGWQTFVERVLRVEPVPDPLDDLPGIDALALGNTVHGVLERIARAALDDPPDRLAALAGREPAVVRWPDDARLEVLLRETAAEVLRDEGIALADLVEVLVRRARPYLERARALDWDAPVPVLGVEVAGEIAVPGPGAPRDPARRLRFRADRVDAAPRGLRLVDYKTGKPVSDGKRAATRRRHFGERVSAGKALQAVAYARAAGTGGAGRYLFLRPDVEDDAADVVAAADDTDLSRRLDAALGRLVAAWDRGGFAPRLVDRDGTEPRACSFCDVAQACLRGDTGARRRLWEWVEAHRDEPPEDPAESALLGLWQLGEDAS